MSEGYQIKTPAGNKEYFKTVVSVLLNAGYKYSNSANLEYIVEKFSCYPWIVIFPPNRLGGNGDRRTDLTEISLEELFLFLSRPRFKEVKLNEEYAAQVYYDKVIVGCTTIPIEAVEEVLKVNKEMRVLFSD